MSDQCQNQRLKSIKNTIFDTKTTFIYIMCHKKHMPFLDFLYVLKHVTAMHIGCNLRSIPMRKIVPLHTIYCTQLQYAYEKVLQEYLHCSYAKSAVSLGRNKKPSIYKCSCVVFFDNLFANL